jgi:tRNA G37 N-methylase Trm5
LNKEYRQKQKITEDFWRRWTKEYLLQLRNYHEVKRRQKKRPYVRVGDIVLLQEDNTPRHMWRRARIEEVREGRDGKVRTVILRRPDGYKITRPIQVVIPQEVDQGGEHMEY